MEWSLEQHVANSKPLVLIVEDEPEIVEILEAYFYKEGFRVSCAENGIKALEMHDLLKPDLIVLDVLMPEMDGWQVLSKIRITSDTPVMMLTASDQDVDKLVGLRLGADDYVVKPFNAAEVVARAEAILRRSKIDAEKETRLLRVYPFQVDLQSYLISVEVNARLHTLQLTKAEFSLLTRLIRSPRKVFTREELSFECLGDGDHLLRTVDSHLSKIRKKLEEIGVSGVPCSVRGLGYRLWRI